MILSDVAQSHCSEPLLPIPRREVQASGCFLVLGTCPALPQPGSLRAGSESPTSLGSARAGHLFFRCVRVGQLDPVTDTVRPRASCSPRPSPGIGGDKSLVPEPQGRNSYTLALLCLQLCDCGSLPCLSPHAGPGGVSVLAQPVLFAPGAEAGAASAAGTSIPPGGAEEALLEETGGQGEG